MKKQITIGMLLSIFLLSGCVTDKEYADSQTGLNECVTALQRCNEKTCPACPECICEQETTVSKPYYEECPYTCPEGMECKEVYDSEGNIRNWQCITEFL